MKIKHGDALLYTIPVITFILSFVVQDALVNCIIVTLSVALYGIVTNFHCKYRNKQNSPAIIYQNKFSNSFTKYIEASDVAKHFYDTTDRVCSLKSSIDKEKLKNSLMLVSMSHFELLNHEKKRVSLSEKISFQRIIFQASYIVFALAAIFCILCARASDDYSFEFWKVAVSVCVSVALIFGTIKLSRFVFNIEKDEDMLNRKEYEREKADYERRCCDVEKNNPELFEETYFEDKCAIHYVVDVMQGSFYETEEYNVNTVKIALSYLVIGLFAFFLSRYSLPFIAFFLDSILSSLFSY